MLGVAAAAAMEDESGEPTARQERDWSTLIAKSRQHTERARCGYAPLVLGACLAAAVFGTFGMSAATTARVLSTHALDTCVDEVASWAYSGVDLAAPPANLVLVLDSGMHRAFDGYTGGAPLCMERLHRTLALRGLRAYAATAAAAPPNATLAVVPRVGVCHRPPCA